MKRKLMSMVTALCLCIALVIPAVAADMTPEEAGKPISLSAVDGQGKEYDPGPQPHELWLGHYDYAAGFLMMEEISACTPTPTDVVFTVSNKGGTGDCFLIVHAIEYAPVSKSAAEEKYDNIMLKNELVELDDLSLVNGDTVYVGDNYYGEGDYLCDDGKWLSFQDGGTEKAVHIGVGQSMSFRLPSVMGEGDFCRLYVDVYYPQTAGDYRYYQYYFDLFMDNSGAATEQTPVTGEAKFTDVSATAYYADAVAWAVDKGITSGTGDGTTFSPDATCTTAQILTFLWRANGSPAPTGSNPFSDVAADAYYADAAVWAYENGLISGSTFGGDTPATRAATVTYLWKLAGMPDDDAVAFTDVEAGAEYAQAVAWAVKEGITSGTSATTFSPDNICTRGQIVTFLYRDLA